jgi:hypothetical protein
MTPAQVRAAIAADFPRAQIAQAPNPDEGTQSLQARLDHLDPAPGPVTVIYIFGARSGTLADVTVLWQLNAPSEDERGAMLAAGAQLRRYFEDLPGLPRTSIGARPLGPNSLVLFGVADAKGAAVELAIDGVSYSTDGKPAGPPPKGPAVLRITYIRNAANPDVLRRR